MDRCSKYLVTGGAGFIGSHLVDALLADGNSVVVLDNLTTGRQENLTQARANPRFRFVHGSVLDAPLVAAPISTNLILAYLSQHVLGLPRSY